MANEEEVHTVFGFVPGAVPPFCLAMAQVGSGGDGGDLTSMPRGVVLVDSGLADHDQLACGAGDPAAFVVIDAAALVALSHGQVRPWVCAYVHS